MFGSLTKSIGRAARTLAFRGGASKDAAEADAEEEVHRDPVTGEVLSKRALARMRGEYIPPSVDEALEHRDEAHPRYAGPRGLQPYPLDIGTGDLGVEMGPGIALYFNFLQWMAAVFFVLFLLNFPTIVVANAAKYWGPYSVARNSSGYQAVWDAAVAGDFDLASTTLGSVAPDDVEEGEWLTYEGLAEYGFVVSVSKRHFLYGACGADVLGTILFLIVMFFFRRRQRAIVRAVDEDSIEISDYSVAVRGLPENATDKEEVRCFFELKFGKVVDAVLAKNDGALVTLYRKRSKLAMRHDEMHARFIKTMKGEKAMEKCRAEMDALDKKIAAMKRKKNFKTKLAFVTFSEEESFVECLDASPRTWLGRWLMKPEERFRGEHAYTVEEAPAPTDVMFENLDVSDRSRSRRRAIIGLVTTTLLLVSFAAITALSALKVQLSLSTAMDPAKLALAIGGPGGGAFGTPESRALAGEDAADVVLADDFNGTVAFPPACAAPMDACEVAYSEVGVLAIVPWGAPVSVVSVGVPMSETERLVKVKSIVNEMEACGLEEPACDVARRGPEVLAARSCHACYCAGLQYATWASDDDSGSNGGHRRGDLVIDSFTDKEIASVREQCDAFLRAPGLFETGLMLVAVASVTIVNSALKAIIKAVSSFERPASFIELQKKVAEKVFVAQFFNTAVSSLVINAALPELVASFPIVRDVVFAGTHRDFDQLWYRQIGGPLMMTMLINTVGPIGGNVAAELTGAVTRFLAPYRAWTQKSLDEAFTGPEFDIATRYGEVLMCVMVTMMYGSGMPMLYAFACFFCVAISYSDKRFLLRVCRRPPRYGVALATLAMEVTPWAAFVHLLFGMWMHTHFYTPSIASSTGTGGLGDLMDDAEDAARANATSSAFAEVLREGATLELVLAIAANASAAAAEARSDDYAPIPGEIRRRIAQTNGFPFFFLALVFLAVMALRAVVSKLWEAAKTVLPCLESLPCVAAETKYEGVPTFEDAYLGDKLVGAHTYEMRDMPMNKDFFFEGKAKRGGPGNGKSGEKKDALRGGADPYDEDVEPEERGGGGAGAAAAAAAAAKTSGDESDGSEADMAHMAALLAGGGGGLGLGLGGSGLGALAPSADRGRGGPTGAGGAAGSRPTAVENAAPAPVSRFGPPGTSGGDGARPRGPMPRFGPPASARFGPPPR